MKTTKSGVIQPV